MVFKKLDTLYLPKGIDLKYKSRLFFGIQTRYFSSKKKKIQ